MLRRKLLIILGPLVTLMIAMAVVAILLLQDALHRLDHVKSDAATAVDLIDDVSRDVAQIESGLHRLQFRAQGQMDAVLGACEAARSATTQLGEHYMVREQELAEPYQQLIARLPALERHVAALATATSPALTEQHHGEALAAAMELRMQVLRMSHLAHHHANSELRHLSNHLHWMVVGMSVGFILLINVSVIILLRTAGLVLRPVERLVEASRALAHEQFEHRVQIGSRDEFEELAQAYNQLAQQLQANEARKLEVLQQTALALNHELNNAMTVIELQLQLIARRSGADEAQTQCLRQIREGLSRMARTVASLKQVRRVVLTDYVAGVKMLDLDRSVQSEPQTAAAAAGTDPT